ncbi:bifunctional 3-(3-hydroxy-phenyl)propionate/3-hydroxycinnamic acid hydroxylase [Gordonia rubripertincta]|uniref:Bifunctional 3-(3-hydroxy-phenyl)propionate/3-hydroxycinnamic acid hydroxylase n=1 Tax=Gordonia rubripertincta TaxID=36822 RepID=A0ABT4N0R1_GORRU|nr:bifunctional 3-(3-hydroxy-phenyl)propionate/3-hydroxycinnamic acid hydroxylase [Gordonia rubripertincta]MCZ4552550.1 bifunctional 3-(3-hydroxy-phenyl)propionate/3-hydroxycinnamic acid hydroxylase [Gordonia rubripertincta]
MSAQVVIVGAGPTGLTAAALLARYGIPSTILERHRGVYPLPRAVHLDDEVYRILQAAGAADDFGPHGRPAEGMRLVDARMRVLMRFARSSANGHHGWRESTMFDQPDLERALRGAVSRQQVVTVREGVDVESVVVSDGVATLQVRGERGPEVLTAQFVLGCDGASSVVASAIGQQAHDLRFRQRWLVVDVRCAADLQMWPGVHQVCTGAQASTFMRIGEDRYRWEFRLPDLDTAAGDDVDEAWALRAVRAQLADADADADTDVEILRTAIYRHAARVARHWQSGPLFVLGDAAHLTPPFIGQGLGAGLRDAMNLAWKLAAVIDGRADERLLRTYESERKPHVVRSVVAATVVGTLMSVRGMPAQTVAHTAMRAVDSVPGAASAGPAFIYPRVGRRRLPLRERARRQNRIVGRTVPQFTSTDEQDTHRRSDEILGCGYVLLVDGHSDVALLRHSRSVGAREMEVGDLGPFAPAMRRWLHTNGARSVLIRPDRVVCAADPIA